MLSALLRHHSTLQRELQSSGKTTRSKSSETLEKCAVVVAVIGNRWPEAPFDNGVCRSHDPKDNVRIELLSALERGIPLIPLLIGTGGMPSGFFNLVNHFSHGRRDRDLIAKSFVVSNRFSFAGTADSRFACSLFAQRTGGTLEIGLKALVSFRVRHGSISPTLFHVFRSRPCGHLMVKLL
jgi:hypothetical protein